MSILMIVIVFFEFCAVGWSLLTWLLFSWSLFDY